MTKEIDIYTEGKVVSRIFVDVASRCDGGDAGEPEGGERNGCPDRLGGMAVEHQEAYERMENGGKGIDRKGRTDAGQHRQSVAGESLGPLRILLEPYDHIFVLVDHNVALGSPFVSGLLAGLRDDGCPVKMLDVSEAVKTMDTMLDICGWLLEEGADRDALVLAIGGGITTDMAGFAASIYKRGVRFAYLPTTLLAQVDASIGGKTGVNFLKYKNILGVIRQPEFTLICPQVLEGLPRRDFLSGAAEMLKTFVIEDGGNYSRATALLSMMSREYAERSREYADKPQGHLKNAADGHGNAGDADAWRQTVRAHLHRLSELVAAAAAVKAGVVSRDQFEKGERRKLNLGHTFAHAIETLAQRTAGEHITHGEAVAMGMVLAARLADRYCRDGRGEAASLEEKMLDDLKASGIRCVCPFSVSEMSGIMKKDKKAEGGKVHFVLPKEIGDVDTVELAVDEVCRLLA